MVTKPCERCSHPKGFHEGVLGLIPKGECRQCGCRTYSEKVELLSWTFYRDSHPTVPYIGAVAPYHTRNQGVWRYGVAPNNGMEKFIHAVRESKL